MQVTNHPPPVNHGEFHVILMVEYKSCNDCPCKHCGVNAVYPAFIPIVETPHRSQEKGETPKRRKQHIANGTASS